MKKLSYLFTRFSFALLLLMSACDNLEDTDVSPFPDSRDKFVGDWSVNNENCGKSKYLVNIRKDLSNSAQVLVSNFAFSQAAVPDTAIIAGSSIVLYKQQNSEGWSIQGTGSYNDAKDEISWQYNLTISGYQENCTAIYVKSKRGG
ncbi:MAG TPA: hypothetical protein VK994_00335 [Bacteroidales bacterium]|nr:hypothetical protein [Bacteroidales bacterium]